MGRHVFDGLALSLRIKEGELRSALFCYAAGTRSRALDGRARICLETATYEFRCVGATYLIAVIIEMA